MSRSDAINSLKVYFTEDEISKCFGLSSDAELEQALIIISRMPPENRARYKASLLKRHSMFGTLLAQLSRERKP
jgi:hypothetical protein